MLEGLVESTLCRVPGAGNSNFVCSNVRLFRVPCACMMAGVTCLQTRGTGPNGVRDQFSAFNFQF